MTGLPDTPCIPHLWGWKDQREIVMRASDSLAIMPSPICHTSLLLLLRAEEGGPDTIVPPLYSAALELMALHAFYLCRVERCDDYC